MARAKDDPLLNRLFEGPEGGKSADGASDEAREAHEALRRDVLGILDAAGEASAVEPLDEGLVSAYLDGALEAPDRAALEARLAASHVLREQVAAAASAREAGHEGGLVLPPDFAADYDAVPGPAKAAQTDPGKRPAGLIGRLIGAPTPARRWLAATVPVLGAVVVVAVIAPRLMSERQMIEQGKGAGTAAPKAAADAKAKRESTEAREADRARRAAPPKPAETARRKADKQPKTARRAGRAGATGNKAEEKKAAESHAIVNTAIVALSSELRDAVVILGRSQQGPAGVGVTGKEQEKRSYEAARPSTGSSSDRTAGESRLEKPGAGLRFRGRSDLTPRHIDVINRAVAPDCAKNPALCCGSHQVDQDLLNRLVASRPPLQSVKVLHLASRACYLTLP